MNITIKAPIKLNLLLDVMPKVVDGRHQLASIFTVCTLFDSLEFEFAGADSGPQNHSARALSDSPGQSGQPDSGIGIKTTYDKDIAPVDIALQDNIIYRAMLELANQTGRTLPRAQINVTKRIPICGGLGGGSSDAAAAIRALAQYWGIKSTAPECLATAEKVGSDVTFFLYGGCALMSGHGQRFIRHLPRPALEFVLVKPEGGNSTAAAYKAFDELQSAGNAGGDGGSVGTTVPGRPAGSDTADGVAARNDGSLRVHQMSLALDAACILPNRFALEALAAQMDNNLTDAAVAVMPQLADLLAELDAQPTVVSAMLAGSGSTCFGLCASREDAQRTAEHFRQRGFWTAACSTPPHCSRV